MKLDILIEPSTLSSQFALSIRLVKIWLHFLFIYFFKLDRFLFPVWQLVQRALAYRAFRAYFHAFHSGALDL